MHASVYPEFLKEVKVGRFTLEEARVEADKAMQHIEMLADTYCENHDKEGYDTEMDELFDRVSFEIMEKSVINDFKKEGLL